MVPTEESKYQIVAKLNSDGVSDWKLYNIVQNCFINCEKKKNNLNLCNDRKLDQRCFIKLEFT